MASKDRQDRYFKLAEEWAGLATCPRASVGCVIISTVGTNPEGGKFLCSGYNGAPDDKHTCMDEECIIEGGHCVRAVHAEIRAIAYAAARGIRLDRAEAYVTLLPCIQCMHALYLAGVRTIYYDSSYERDEAQTVRLLAEGLGVKLVERIRS